MNYLHHCNPPIIHRDLKSSNLLVDKNLNVKVNKRLFEHFLFPAKINFAPRIFFLPKHGSFPSFKRLISIPVVGVSQYPSNCADFLGC